MAIGRPSEYTQEMGDIICAEMEKGRTITAICLDDGMPAHPTVFRWCDTFPLFRSQYARAKELQCESIASQIIDLGDTPVRAERIKTTDGGIGADGNPTPGKIEITTGDNVERTKLQMEARKWYLGKVMPKKYGERLELAGDKDAPLTITVRRRDKEG